MFLRHPAKRILLWAHWSISQRYSSLRTIHRALWEQLKLKADPKLGRVTCPNSLCKIRSSSKQCHELGHVFTNFMLSFFNDLMTAIDNKREVYMPRQSLHFLLFALSTIYCLTRPWKRIEFCSLNWVSRVHVLDLWLIWPAIHTMPPFSLLDALYLLFNERYISDRFVLVYSTLEVRSAMGNDYGVCFEYWLSCFFSHGNFYCQAVTALWVGWKKAASKLEILCPLVLQNLNRTIFCWKLLICSMRKSIVKKNFKFR